MGHHDQRVPFGTHRTRTRWRPSVKRLVSTAAAIALLASAMATGGLVTVATPAQAAPGTPGMPQPSSVVYAEDFEANASDASVLLTNYVGEAPSFQTYTAHPAWLRSCNGNILTFNTDDLAATTCTGASYLTRLRQLAYALGEHNGATNPASNHAVSAYTEAPDPGANRVEFATVEPIQLASASGRFLTFSVDTAALNCSSSAPRYQFSFMSGTTAIPIGGQINACSSKKTVLAPAVGGAGAVNVRIGTYTSNGSMLFDGSALGIQMTNANGSSAGNDAAFDNIRILDVTPQLDKIFSPVSAPVGGQSTLTFTVTNTDELASKNGWSFTDNLPAGLTVAGAASTTCPAGVPTAAVGGTSLSVTGNLATGMASCTVSVPVTALTAGSYTNGPDNVTTKGLDEPGETTVTFSGPLVTCSSDGNIFNTGYDATTGKFLADNAKDANWQVSGPFEKPTPVTSVSMPPAEAAWGLANVGKLAAPWADSPYGNAQWISQQSIASPVSTDGDWYYRYQFNLDPAVTPSIFSLGMNFLADNNVAEVFVNGVAQSGKTTGLPQAPAGSDGYRYAGHFAENAASTTLNNDWVTGSNTIIVQIKSDRPMQGFDAQVRPSALCPDPSYTVAKSVSSATALPGDTLTYTVSVANTGNTAYRVEDPASFSDDLAEVLDDASYNNDATEGATVTAERLSWAGALAVGETKTITYSVTVNSLITGDQTLVNSVVPGTGGSCVAASDCTVTTDVASFSVVKSSTATEVVAGDVVPYTITVTNTGKVAYTAERPALFTDDLSAVLDDAAYNNDADQGATYAAPTLSWSGALAVGESKTIAYSVSVNDPLTGDQQLDNAVVTPPNSGGDCPVNTDNANCVSEVPGKSFTVEKSASSATAVPGDTITYTVTVKNTGKRAFTEDAPASFSDDLAKVLDDAAYNDDVSNGAVVEGAKLSWSGALALGESKTITYSVTVNSPATGDGVLSNAVIPTSPGGECATVGGCTTETGVQSYTVNKSSDPAGDVAPGETVTYTVFVKNVGTVDYTAAAAASFTDDLAMVLDDATYNDDASNGGVVADGKLSWAGAIKAGETATVTYSVTVNNPDLGDHVLENAAVPNGPGGVCQLDCAPVTNKVAEYKVVKKASSATVLPGDKVTYTVTVTNTGAVAYTDTNPASFSDDLAAVVDDATYNDDASNGATVTDGKLSWAGPLQVGEMVEVTYSVTVNNPLTGDRNMTNTVVPTGTGGMCTTAADCTTLTEVSSFTVVKEASTATTTPGEAVTYTVTVTNTGAVAYTVGNPASFTDNMADVLDDASYNNDATEGATFEAPVLSWAGALALGESKTITYSVTVNNPITGDHVLRNAVVTPVDGGCVAGSDVAACGTETPVAAYKLVKSVDTANTVPGEKVTYTITVENIGAVAYTGENQAAFTDDLSNILDDATYNDDASNGAAYAAPVLSWMGDLEVGETQVVTYSATVNTPSTGDGKLENTVVSTVPGGTCEAGTTNPECSTTVPGPNLEIVKKASADTAVPGDKITYTITVENTGEGDFTEDKPASFSDDLSAVLDDASYNGDITNGATNAAPVLSWNGALASGEAKTFTYSVTVNSPATGDRALRNVVTTPPTVPSNCLAASTDADCATTTKVSTFEVAKTVSAETAKPGDTITYTLTVTNTGQLPYTDENPAGFNDDLTKVLDDATYNGDASNGAVVKDGTLSWTGALELGETKTITYTVIVNSPATGDRTLTNAAIPNGPGGECATVDCPAVNTLVSSFEIAKTTSSKNVKGGEKVSYTITVTNTGQLDYTVENPASFTDDMSKVLANAAFNNDASNGATLTGKTLTWAGPLETGKSTTITYSVTVDTASQETELVNVVVAPADSGAVCQSGATSPDCSTTTVVDPPKPGTPVIPAAPAAPAAPAEPLAITGTTIGLGILGLALALVAAGGTLMLTRRNRSRQS